jgi:hypothetical protein
VADKRNVERFDLDLKAFVSEFDDTDESKSCAMQTRDVSTNGVFLFTDTPLPVGTRVKVDMVLALDELKKIGGKALIKTSGKVLRMEAGGMAICFDRNSKILPFSKEKMI